MESVLALPVQYLFAVLSISTALLMVISRNPIVSALSLMGTLFSTAAMFLWMGSFFLGAVQILVYAGAIAVLFVFIVMLLDHKQGKIKVPGRTPVRALGVMAGGLLFCVLSAGFLSKFFLFEANVLQGFRGGSDFSTAKAVSENFISTYMLPFQVTGFIILAAILGVIILAQPVRDALWGGKDSK